MASELVSTIASNLHTICEQDTALDTTKSWLELQFSFALRHVRLLKKYQDTQKKDRLVNGTNNGGAKVQTDEMRTQFTGHSDSDHDTMLELCMMEKLMEALRTAERSGDLVDLDPVLLSEMQAFNKVGHFSSDFLGHFLGHFMGHFLSDFMGAFMGAFMGDFLSDFLSDFSGEFLNDFLGDFWVIFGWFFSALLGNFCVEIRF